MTVSDRPLIYVDLLKEEPMTLAEFTESVRFDTAVADVDTAYGRYCDRFQPWRILVRSGDNYEPLFRSTESYFNEADAHHAAQIAFGSNSNVYLRQKEHGNVELRLAT